MCAEIKIHNNVYRNGYDGKAEELISLLDKLETYVSLKQYDQQRTMVAAITMESYYHLGMYCESAYTGKAIEVYNKLPETIRENKFVLFYYAICSEMEGNKEDAMEAYSKLDWKSEPAFAERYMLCCILNDQVDKAVEIYGQITDGNLRLRSICLFALDRMGSSDYKTKLEELLKENKDDIVAMFNIAYFVEDEKIFNVFVMPILQNIISAQGIGNLRDDQSIQLAALLSHFGEIELLETVLNKITDTNLSLIHI